MVFHFSPPSSPTSVRRFASSSGLQRGGRVDFARFGAGASATLAFRSASAVVASDDALWAFSNEVGLDGPLDPAEFALHVAEAGLARRNASLLKAVDAARGRLDALRS